MDRLLVAYATQRILSGPPAEYKTFSRVGGVSEIDVNIRLVAATNSDLEERMHNGQFLRDLYDRLAFEEILVPSLRERQGDIDVLTEFFLNQFMNEIPTFQGKIVSNKALDMLRKYSFPGNVRELKNIIERAVYRDTTNELTPEDFGLSEHESEEIHGGSFKENIESFERHLILDTLEKAKGNQAKAARMLGLSYHQFRYYYKKYKSGFE